MTLIYELDLDILKMCRCCVKALEQGTQTHTDATERSTTPHSPVVLIHVFIIASVPGASNKLGE